MNEHSVVADIGSGTGISSELFLQNGNVVFGVEPNAEMRGAAKHSLRHYARFMSVAGTAEATTLDDKSVDVIVAGQAFHWFDRVKAKMEFHRIAKPHAHAVLMWNDRDNSSAFMTAYEHFVQAFATDYNTVNHKNISDEHIAEFFRPERVQRISFENKQVFDFDGLQGRTLSASYMPSRHDPRFSAMNEALQQVFDTYQRGGAVAFELETRLYWGRCGEQ